MLNQSDGLDRMFHALADPSRRRLVEQLGRGPATVSDLAKPLKMSLPSVLQHLQVLEDSGLIKSKKTGRVRTCRVEPKAINRAEQWLARQRAVWEGRFDRLESYLQELQAKEE
jgi:DNA-binding transcriptional ArsR family regulator